MLNQVVENPERTAEYIARRDARRAALKTDLAKLLADQTRITLEVGAGHGHFLVEYAAAHPEEFCVGIDLLRERVERALRKRNRAKRSNLAFVQADAAEFLEALPPTLRFQRTFVLFPDPWPKRRHHKNRIMRSEFLSTIAARSPVGALLCFRTDDSNYFAAAKAEVQAHADWKITENISWPFERETVFQSRAQAFQSLIAERC
ncbi:MAG: tRNA (guanosine(46)-N7)-methyltransferase TrmB [Nibricoccus sp.]